MRRRIVIFLIRTRFGLKKYQQFRFVGQKSNAVYYFTESNLMKDWHSSIMPSGVSLNWLLDNECVIEKV